MDCSGTTSVAITFSNLTNYQETFATWPSLDFLLLTNHLGDCDIENERGLYLVNPLLFDNDTLTITADASGSSFANQTSVLAVYFNQTQQFTVAKREITQTWLADFPGTFSFPSVSSLVSILTGSGSPQCPELAIWTYVALEASDKSQQSSSLPAI